jgi:hypothetical protein
MYQTKVVNGKMEFVTDKKGMPVPLTLMEQDNKLLMEVIKMDQPKKIEIENTGNPLSTVVILPTNGREVAES